MAKQKKSASKPVVVQKVGVSERALFMRIDRALKKDNMTLRRCREDSCDYPHNLGRYYTIDFSTSLIQNNNVDLEGLGRTLRVLRPYEMLIADEPAD